MKSSFTIHPILAYILFYFATIAAMLGGTIAVLYLWNSFGFVYNPLPSVCVGVVWAVVGICHVATRPWLMRHISFRDS